MATIGDVAKAAGVSRSTASNVLSGNKPTSPEIQERVRRAVDALGYTPNAGARALATLSAPEENFGCTLRRVDLRFDVDDRVGDRRGGKRLIRRGDADAGRPGAEVAAETRQIL